MSTETFSIQRKNTIEEFKMENIYEKMDNALPKLIFNKLQSFVFSGRMDWHYTGTAFKGANEDDIFSFSFYNNIIFGQYREKNIADLVEDCFLFLMDKTGQNFKELARARIGLIMPTPHPVIHDPHVDYEQSHRTALLYLNDADGNTLLYNEMYDPKSGTNSHDYFRLGLNKSVTVAAESTPEANKFLWFDGLRYHSSTSPTQTARRVAINFNYTTA